MSHADAIRRGEAKIKSGKRLVYGDPDVIAVLQRDEHQARLNAAAENCIECHGKKVIHVKEDCSECDGTGEKEYDEDCACQNVP